MGTIGDCQGEPDYPGMQVFYSSRHDTYAMPEPPDGDPVPHSDRFKHDGGLVDLMDFLAGDWLGFTDPPGIYENSDQAEDDEFVYAGVCECVKKNIPQWRVWYLNHWLTPPLTRWTSW